MQVVEPETKRLLPNASTVLVLGILSIVLSCGVGLVLGIIGLLMSREGKELYEQNPNKYLGWGNLNAGRIMSIIGLCLNGLAVLYLLFWIVLVGTIAGTVFDQIAF